jgi:hypothetical protein
MASDPTIQAARATRLDLLAQSLSQATMSMRARRQQQESTTGFHLAYSLKLTSGFFNYLLLLVQ